MLVIHPGEVEGEVRGPPSKSHTHRCLLLAGLTDETTVHRPLRSADTLASLRAAAAFGATVRDEGDRIVLEGGSPRTPEDVVDCANSGTTLRLATALAGLAPGTTVLTGDASLRARPMGPLLEALADLGAEAFSTRGDGRAPVIVRGPLEGGHTSLPGDVSSQFVSGLLLAGVLAPEGVTVRLTSPLRSRPYVDLTLHVLRAFSARASPLVDGRGYRAPGGQQLTGGEVTVPGDWSSAAFPLAAAAVTGGRVTVTGLDLQDPQGDRAIADHLGSFGARITRGNDAVTVDGGDGLHGTSLDLGDTPDLFPVLAAVAAHAEGETELRGAAHLRWKESDRIAATVAMLRDLGGRAEERDDGALVTGSTLKGGRFRSEHDHRILMAGIVAALGARGPSEVADEESHRVSYPEFLDHMGNLGASLEVVD